MDWSCFFGGVILACVATFIARICDPCRGMSRADRKVAALLFQMHLSKLANKGDANDES